MVLLASGGDNWIGVLVFFAIVVFNIIGSIIKNTARKKPAEKSVTVTRTPDPVDPTDPLGSLWEALGKPSAGAPQDTVAPRPETFHGKLQEVLAQEQEKREALLRRQKQAPKLPPIPVRFDADKDEEEETEGPAAHSVAEIATSPPLAVSQHYSNERLQLILKRLQDREEAQMFFLAQEIFRPAGGSSYDPIF